MSNMNFTTDNIRTSVLFDFMEDVSQKDGKPVKFRWKGDGLQLISDLDTVRKDWAPQEVEEALAKLEEARVIGVSYATEKSGFDVEAYPFVDWRELSRDEVARIVQNNGRLCAELVLYLDELCHYVGAAKDYGLISSEETEVPDYQLFRDMARDLKNQNDITQKQLAISRMPDESGLPRLVKYQQQVESVIERVWRPLTQCILDGLVKKRIVIRDGDRYKVARVSVTQELLTTVGLKPSFISWQPVRHGQNVLEGGRNVAPLSGVERRKPIVAAFNAQKIAK